MTLKTPSLTHDGRAFFWHGGFETKDLPKQAGFRWDSARKCWWTTEIARAQRLSAYADNDAQAAFRVTQARIAASRASSEATGNIPCPNGLAYLPYQRAGIAYALERDTLIGDEMGLGKTIQALGIANASDATTILVVCPASLRLNWHRETQKWLCRAHVFHIVEGGTDVPPREATCIIVNYDVLSKPSIQASLMARQWDLLIVDEAHYCKSGAKAQRAVAVLGKEAHGKLMEEGLIHRASRRIFLTGTPLMNRPIELWPLAHALDPRTFANFFAYAQRYCNAHRVDVWRKMVWDFSGSSHLEELQLLLRGSCLVRRLKKDVLPELPPKRRQIIELPQNGARHAVQAEVAAWDAREAQLERFRADVALAHAGGHEDAYVAAVERLRSTMRVAFEEIARLRHETAVHKAPKVAEYICTLLDSTDKIVVFAWHHDVINKIAQEVRKYAAKNCRGFNGKTIREMDGYNASPQAQEQTNEMAMSMPMRTNQRSTRADTQIRTIQGMSQMSADETWEGKNQRIQMDGPGQTESQGPRDSVSTRFAQFQNPKTVPPVGDTDPFYAQALSPEQSIDRPHRSDKRIHAGQYMGDQLESERHQTQRDTQRVGNAHAKPTNTSRADPVAVVTGETPLAQRQDAVDAFQTDPAVRVFLGNIQAAGLGITLTAASTVVFAELDWTPAAMTQAEDRTHRIGQTESVLVQHLVYDGSLDARMAKLLLAKQAIADAALDSEPLVPTAAALSESATAAQAQRPRAYPTATAAQREASLAGVQLLTALNPDGTTLRNAAGWNAIDAHIGARLAVCETMTDGQVWLAMKILSKYRRTQLPPTVTAALWPGVSAALRQGESI